MHSSRHVGQVRHCCTKLFFAGNAVSCICRGMHRQSNQFQMTLQKYITDASNLIGKVKFVVAVVGPVTLLSTDAALQSRLTSRQVHGTLLLAITNLCQSLASHYVCTPGDMLFPPIIGGLIHAKVMIFIIGIY